ncbi:MULTISPECIES: proline racemase family protein [Streptomyces]|uniref:Proline racemase family protein n=2 Tax=Streptomyces TaxID=1883 RepID=A0ABV9J0B9_9ACTN
MAERRPVLAVVGAGPAGLAAALAAAARGVRVVLVDSAAEPGGQFYRQPARGLGARRPQALHHRWRTWERLRTGLDAHMTAGRATLLIDRHVWCVEGESSGFTVHTLLGPEQEESTEIRADGVLLATGGYEKVLPFPGWTLPGVITAGGAQALLKGGFVLPGRTAVVAGTGPLLLPVATGLAAAGARVSALVESADPRDFVRRSRTLAGHPAGLAEGAAYAVQLLCHKVNVMFRHTIRHAMAIHPGWFDRSPCGTGTSARMAQLHARGELPLHTEFVNESFIGTRFTGRLLGTTEVAGRPAVLPSFTGRAWITGTAQYLLDPTDPTDPFPAGFVL